MKNEEFRCRFAAICRDRDPGNKKAQLKGGRILIINAAERIPIILISYFLFLHSYTRFFERNVLLLPLSGILCFPFGRP